MTYTNESETCYNKKKIQKKNKLSLFPYKADKGLSC